MLCSALSPLKGEAEKYKRVFAEIYGGGERRDLFRCAQGHVTFLSLKELKAFLFPMKKKKEILQICIFSSVLSSRSRFFFNKPKRGISLLCCPDHVHFGQLCAIFVFRGLAEKKK